VASKAIQAKPEKGMCVFYVKNEARIVPLLGCQKMQLSRTWGQGDGRRRGMLLGIYF
jgi:hypothetical protein